MAESPAKLPSFVAKFELGERRLDVVETLLIVNALGANPNAFLDEHVKHLPERL